MNKKCPLAFTKSAFMEEGKLARAPTKKQGNYSSMTRPTFVVGYSCWLDSTASDLIRVSGTQRDSSK